MDRENMVYGEILESKPVTLKTLNQAAISKLHELISSLDAKSEPDMVRSCIESLAKLNQSVKGNDVLTTENDEERKAREKTNIVEGLLKK